MEGFCGEAVVLGPPAAQCTLTEEFTSQTKKHNQAYTAEANKSAGPFRGHQAVKNMFLSLQSCSTCSLAVV